MKKRNASLEKKRPLLFTAGLLFAISLSLVSFEWRTPYEAPEVFAIDYSDPPESVWIPVTLSEPEKKKERPEPPKIEKPTGIDIVDKVEEPRAQKDPFVLSLNDLPKLDGPLILNDDKDVADLPKEPIRYASEMPKYCGGESAMFEFLSKELNYPDIPRSNGVSGTVQIQFIVGKNGKLRDAKVVKPIDPWLDAEALRVAKMLDCFTPGIQGGHEVDVYFVLPIKFALSQ